jgi:hypothetical protein
MHGVTPTPGAKQQQIGEAAVIKRHVTVWTVDAHPEARVGTARLGALDQLIGVVAEALDVNLEQVVVGPELDSVNGCHSKNANP